MIDITGRKINVNTSVALGFFDGLHLGHIEVIKSALSVPDLTSVVFTFNPKTLLPKFNVRQNILTHELKIELLSKIGVDYIFAPDFADLRDFSPEHFVDEVLINQLNAKNVCCGYDFHFGKNGSGEPDLLKQLCTERGINATIVPAVTVDNEIVSSSKIRELISAGNVETANKYLGYELTYVLEVERGRRLGHQLGFPTINQTIPKGTIVPKYGVYKSWTQVNRHNYPSITNIGVKPTIDATNIEPVMETHIIGFSGELYGLRARVVLRQYMRGEVRFDSLDELKKQIQLDKDEAIKYT